ncbi:MAG: hypothetical protein Q8O22_08060 [Candidatus Omnitrophota bacterium]|nr:hypothetical protein [Candidatus Omnitrophota bacterium]
MQRLAFIFVLGGFLLLGVVPGVAQEENNQASSARALDPASVYAEKLGYKYQITKDGQRIVIFPDSSQCSAGDFLNNKCGQEWSCCEQHGGKLEKRTEDMGGGISEYAICTFAGGFECGEYDYAGGNCAPGDYKKWSPDPARRIKVDRSASDQLK